MARQKDKMTNKAQHDTDWKIDFNYDKMKLEAEVCAKQDPTRT
jgi:hypothetical protein